MVSHMIDDLKSVKQYNTLYIPITDELCNCMRSGLSNAYSNA